MNIQQLEYIVAVDQYRHFVTASEKCFVTQPTLSMMIKKLEEELNVLIFDRSEQPVRPTPAGELIIRQAKKILSETHRMKEMILEEKNSLKGELRLGVIPTLAPYLIPLFTGSFTKKYPKINFSITEMITEQIVDKIKKNELDAGLLVTPVHDSQINEEVLFYEQFSAYVSEKEKISKKKYILPDEIDPNKLWLLEEGHCFRSQVMNLCELKKSGLSSNLQYEAGSIETLIRLVEKNGGITIIPELAELQLTKTQQKRIRSFKSPVPLREVSLITEKNYFRKKFLEVLKEEILENLPPLSSKKGTIIEI